jgi:hypothetical protein
MTDSASARNSIVTGPGALILQGHPHSNTRMGAIFNPTSPGWLPECFKGAESHVITLNCHVGYPRGALVASRGHALTVAAGLRESPPLRHATSSRVCRREAVVVPGAGDAGPMIGLRWTTTGDSLFRPAFVLCLFLVFSTPAWHLGGTPLSGLFAPRGTRSLGEDDVPRTGVVARRLAFRFRVKSNPGGRRRQHSRPRMV